MTTTTRKYTATEIREHRKEWLDALRDPSRRQVTGALCKIDSEGNVKGECCLGVAANISPIKPLILSGSHSLRYWPEGVGDFGQSMTLPRPVQEWLGLTTDCPSLKDGLATARRTDLTFLNDDGVPFAKIADLIEEQGLVEDEFPEVGWDFR